MLDAYLLGDDGAEQTSTESTKYETDSSSSVPPASTSSVDRAFDELMNA